MASSIRGQLDFELAWQCGREPIPVGSLESVSEIVKRFRMGVASCGSIPVELSSEHGSVEPRNMVFGMLVE